MNSNTETLKVEEADATELKVEKKRSSANQNNQYSLDVDTLESVDIIELEEESEYLQKQVSGTGHEQTDPQKNANASNNSNEAEGDEDDHSIEEANNVASYRLERQSPTANTKKIEIHEECEPGSAGLKRNYSDGAICIDDIPRGISLEDAETLK